MVDHHHHGRPIGRFGAQGMFLEHLDVLEAALLKGTLDPDLCHQFGVGDGQL
jgi:hypothetical protein